MMILKIAGIFYIKEEIINLNKMKEWVANGLVNNA
jgi:hypothetical protein